VNQHERAERLTRRIESFSDLVIGFSLALVALTLQIPAHIVDLVHNPWWLIAYFWTFTVIASIWFNHQRLFTHYFWPDALAIGLNFALLSMVGLLVYFVQVFVHLHTEFDRIWAFLAYFTAFGMSLVFMGVLYLHGTRRRWAALDAQDRYIGARMAVRALLLGGLMLIGVAVSALRPARSMDDVWPVMWAVAAGALGVRASWIILKRRIVDVQTVR